MAFEGGPPVEAGRLNAFIGGWRVEGVMTDGSDNFGIGNSLKRSTGGVFPGVCTQKSKEWVRSKSVS